MNRIYGTDGNVYETSISNGKENTSLKNEKEEFAIAELNKIKAEIKSYEIRRKLEFPNCRDCIFCTKDTFTEIYRTIDKHISELKGEQE